MKKGLLTSIICFSSLVFSSCGSKMINVKILECTHCSFEDIKTTKVGKDCVIQAYPQRGYYLDTDTDLIEIYAGGVHLLEACFNYDQSTNKLTIDKKYTTFGDITVKGTGCVKENKLTYTTSGVKTYDQDITTLEKYVNVEGNDYEQEITSGGNPIDKNDITISPSDVVFTYNDDGDNDNKIKIKKENLYTDIVITLA